MGGYYMNNLNFYKDLDLTRIGEEYCVNAHDLPRDILSKCEDLFAFCDESGTDIVRYADVEREGLWEYAKYFCFDGAERAFALEDLLKDANHYLVMAHNCRWNGASGFMLTDSLEEVLDRDYEVSIYPVAVSKGGKCLVCRESSHDVPMGSRTSIIALTEREYERLCPWTATWDDVVKFAETHEAKAVRKEA